MSEQTFIEKTIKDIYGMSEAIDTCGYAEVFDQEILNIVKLIDSEIDKEDPTEEKREMFELMGEYPEEKWDEIVAMRVVTLLAIKNYAECIHEKLGNYYANLCEEVSVK